MIIFEGIAVCVGVLLVVSHLVERIPAQRGVLLGIAAGLGFGISDVAIKALPGDLDSGRTASSAPGASSSSQRRCSRSSPRLAASRSVTASR
jgi:drug/metabolite transporter (DMT)-like permease